MKEGSPELNWIGFDRSIIFIGQDYFVESDIAQTCVVVTIPELSYLVMLWTSSRSLLKESAAADEAMCGLSAPRCRAPREELASPWMRCQTRRVRSTQRGSAATGWHTWKREPRFT
jgi:hypothetical protein